MIWVPKYWGDCTELTEEEAKKFELAALGSEAKTEGAISLVEALIVAIRLLAVFEESEDKDKLVAKGVPDLREKMEGFSWGPASPELDDWSGWADVELEGSLSFIAETKGLAAERWENKDGEEELSEGPELLSLKSEREELLADEGPTEVDDGSDAMDAKVAPDEDWNEGCVKKLKPVEHCEKYIFVGEDKLCYLCFLYYWCYYQSWFPE